MRQNGAVGADARQDRDQPRERRLARASATAAGGKGEGLTPFMFAVVVIESMAGQCPGYNHFPLKNFPYCTNIPAIIPGPLALLEQRTQKI